MTNTLVTQLRERGNGDIADGYEDKTERGQLDLRAAAEIERLRAFAQAVIDEEARCVGQEGPSSDLVWRAQELLKGSVHEPPATPPL